MSHQITIQAQPAAPLLPCLARLVPQARYVKVFCQLPTVAETALAELQGKDHRQGTVEFGVIPNLTKNGQRSRQEWRFFRSAVPLSELVIECREIGAIKDVKVKTLPCRVQVK